MPSVVSFLPDDASACKQLQWYMQDRERRVEVVFGDATYSLMSSGQVFDDHLVCFIVAFILGGVTMAIIVSIQEGQREKRLEREKREPLLSKV